MEKNDKELAVELTQSFVQSWNAKESTKALSAEQVCEIVTALYKTIHELEPAPKRHSISEDYLT